MIRTYEQKIAESKVKRLKNSKLRRRKVLKMRITLFTITMFVLIMIFSILFNNASAKIDVRKEDYPTYTVKTNDTLWDIANKYTDDSTDIRETIYIISEVNNIDENDNLQVGETLIIPIN